MRNDECVIYIVTKGGAVQRYVKDDRGWTQKSSKGIIRRMSAEQLLSHILPPLSKEDKRGVRIIVKRRKKKVKKKSKK